MSGVLTDSLADVRLRSSQLKLDFAILIGTPPLMDTDASVVVPACYKQIMQDGLHYFWVRSLWICVVSKRSS